jgi:hypothetical protein
MQLGSKEGTPASVRIAMRYRQLAEMRVFEKLTTSAIASD